MLTQGDCPAVSRCVRNQALFSSESNIINMLGRHEYELHGIQNMGNTDKDHRIIYPDLKRHKSWQSTTIEYKDHVNKRVKELGL